MSGIVLHVAHNVINMVLILARLGKHLLRRRSLHKSSANEDISLQELELTSFGAETDNTTGCSSPIKTSSYTHLSNIFFVQQRSLTSILIPML